MSLYLIINKKEQIHLHLSRNEERCKNSNDIEEVKQEIRRAKLLDVQKNINKRIVREKVAGGRSLT